MYCQSSSWISSMNIYQKLLTGLRRALTGSPYNFTYAADGFAVRKKFVPFLKDDKFEKAWSETTQVNDAHWDGQTPDIRWRCHVCIWAASNCLNIEGDFAEFGVNTGMLSSMVLKLTDFEKSGKKFYLYDTFDGIPEDMATSAEIAHTKKMNATLYKNNILEVAKSVFAPYSGVEFAVGRLPETIAPSGIKKIAYASIDLNSAVAEMATVTEIWDMMTSGGMIVLDDYGFGGHEDQNQAWNEFAKSKGRIIFSVPTGQGILMC